VHDLAGRAVLGPDVEPGDRRAVRRIDESDLSEQAALQLGADSGVRALRLGRRPPAVVVVVSERGRR